MPKILRKVKKANWRYDDQEWLSVDEIQSDVLNDLQSKQNKLSIWIVEDDESNLNRILAALSANRDNPSNLDYVLLDFEILEELGIKHERTNGNTIDEELNKQYHIDFKYLSTQKILDLSFVIKKSGDITCDGNENQGPVIQKAYRSSISASEWRRKAASRSSE